MISKYIAAAGLMLQQLTTDMSGGSSWLSDWSDLNLLPIESKDFALTIGEVATKNGYYYELHEVQSEDGYILQLDRISKTTELKNAPRVLLMHGIELSAENWTDNSPDKAPAFILADAGFDVWLGNNRGTEYSQKHISLTPRDLAFWDFSFEEMGLYDTPAFIDKILGETGDEALDAYIGFSQGTTQFFIGSAMEPEYFAQKVKKYVAIAPIVRMDHQSDPAVSFLAKNERLVLGLDLVLRNWNPWFADLFDFSKSFRVLLAYISTQIPQTFISLYDFGTVDPQGEIINTVRFPTAVAHTVVGLSWRCLAHYAQIIHHKQFQRYDFGKLQNMKRYGTFEPPKYDLSKIQVPMALVHGDNDPLANPTDVAWLINDSGIDHDLIELDVTGKWSHFAFLIGTDTSYFSK